MKQYFGGYYFKHQKGDHTISFIVGIAEYQAFIQVITEKESHYMAYPLSEYSHDDRIRLGRCEFTRRGIKIHIDRPDIHIHGRVRYEDITPLKYHIMGPFTYLPMQCRHDIVSMYHKLTGYMDINGERIDLSGGIGYMEGDRGTSFPKEYMWVQSNDFADKCSISASVADIPVGKFRFRGTIAVVYLGGKEYRLATYLGVRVLHYGSKRLTLKQGKYLLDIIIEESSGHHLLAPHNGSMSKIIQECIAGRARFRFYRGKECLFDRTSDHVSMEFVT